MLISKIKALINPSKYAPRKNPDHFLNFVSGVVHVGANIGQEREFYHNLGLHVLWVEPIPSVYAELEENIKNLPNQRAFQSLITDEEDKDYSFHIANNNGASSSILDFKQHKDIWPEVGYTHTVSLRSITLASLFIKEQINPKDYQALVMDTQGSELLVLKGSLPILQHFKYIKTEVPDFESYEGCCQLKDISAFMQKNGFNELSRTQFASRPEGGNYFDIVYKQQP